MKYNPALVWTAWLLFFFVFEAIGLCHEWATGNDGWTLTHYVSKHLPGSFRAMLIGWLAYHFLIQHKNS